jgi:hypothetical protein
MTEFAFGHTQEQFANFEKARQQEAPNGFARKPKHVPEEDTAERITHIRTMINNIYVSAPPQEERSVSQKPTMEHGSVGEAIGSAVVEVIMLLLAAGKKVFGKDRNIFGQQSAAPLHAGGSRKIA